MQSSDISVDHRIKYVEKLCELTGDDEVRNRIGCNERQQEKFEAGEETYGVKELSDFLNVISNS